MNDISNAYTELAKGILERARMDYHIYSRAIKKYTEKQKPTKKEKYILAYSKREFDGVKKFIGSDLFNLYCAITDYDPDRIKKMILANVKLF